MQIDYCLILAAGHGTRMREIGEVLPKVLWPIFEKSLLELQVAFARSLGVRKIFINLHHKADEILQFCKTKPIFEEVTFLIEKPDILDIGGGIHNLAARSDINYHGRLLVLNADQFFFMNKEYLFKVVAPYEHSPSILFTYLVNSSFGYNALSIGTDRLVKGIIQNKEIPTNNMIETYTGISIVDLSKLVKINGASKFFDSVCPFTKLDIPAVLLKNIDYWDFGTLERYWFNMYRVLEEYRVNSNHPFLRFLVGERALKTWKIDLKNLSYHSKSAKVINMNEETLMSDFIGPAILLNGSVEMPKSNHLYYLGIESGIK